MKLNVIMTKTMIVSRQCTMQLQSPLINYWWNCAEGARWPWCIGSDIWLQDDFWEAPSLGFHHSFSKAWYLQKVLFCCVVLSWISGVYCVCCTRSGVIWCTLFMVHCLGCMFQRRLHAVLCEVVAVGQAISSQAGLQHLNVLVKLSSTVHLCTSWL